MFELIKKDSSSKARLGKVRTAHGDFDTPAFMPVGTQGSVKALDPRELKECDAQIILGNTYHLYLRPGLDVLREAGGLHKFINWDRPILTDSGGFQVFSLAKIRKLKPHGVEFRSHLDGSTLFLGPKEAMAIQRVIGSDIAMVLDECPPHDSPRPKMEEAVQRTLRWAEECLRQPRAENQKYFGIVQGGSDPEMRRKCAEGLTQMDFDGYAVGGVSVGESEPEMMLAVEYSEPFLPEHKPRYAMGLGIPNQLVELVARGIDMFDCVLPTRVARNGTAFTYKGAIHIKAAYQKTEWGPIEEGCECYACQNFSRAYLRHLIHVQEILGLRMLSVHNTFMYQRLMRDIRKSIADGTFETFRADFARNYVPSAPVRKSREDAASSKV